MEATRLREWEKSRQAELEAHRQVKYAQNMYYSVPNSSSGLLFVKIRAETGRIFSKNPGKIRAKIRAKLNFVILSSFYDLGHVQTSILRFGEQPHNALIVH